jgi:hypothetical protein
VSKKGSKTVFTTASWQGVKYSGNHELFIPAHVRQRVRASFGQRYTARGSIQQEGIFVSWMKCGDPACQCAVIYDPKVKQLKSTGETKVYSFYHCSNGKRVHGKQVNVTEAVLWQQMEVAVERVTLSRERAEEIADALNEAHNLACEAVRKEMAAYMAALLELEGREDMAYDDLKRGVLDDQGYKRQLKRVRDDRHHYTGLLEEAQLNLNGAYKETAQSILELAIDAKQLWLSRTPLERREFLSRLLSNRVLNGTNVQYELRKPFGTIAEMRLSIIERGVGI